MQLYVGKKLKDVEGEYEVFTIHTTVDRKERGDEREQQYVSVVATCVILEGGEIPEGAITAAGTVKKAHEKTFGISTDDPEHGGYEGLELMIAEYNKHHGVGGSD